MAMLASPVAAQLPSATTVPAAAAGPPVLFEISPPNGPLAGGTPVELWGQDPVTGVLDTVTNVYFGDVPATSFHYHGGGSVTAIAPSHHAGTVNVTLDSAAGRSIEQVPFEYTDNGPPTLNSIVPNHGPVHGGTTVVVTGRGFATTNAVTFGGLPATFTIDSDTKLTVVSPALDYSGVLPIGVSNAVGESARCDSCARQAFTYVSPPTVSQVSPGGGSTAGGTPVDVDVFLAGSPDAATTKVRFGDIEVPFTAAGEGFVVFSVASPPHAAGPVAVTVEDENGSSSADLYEGNTYFYAPPGVPSVSRLDPGYGTELGGTEVFIGGVDLQNVTGVRFGATPAVSFQLHFEEGVQYVTAVSPAHAVGAVEVTLESAAGDSTPGPNSKFLYEAQPPPVVFELYPSEGSVAGGNGVLIWGQGFEQATGVTFGGVPALSFTIEDGTTIHAVAPPAADQTVDSIVEVTVTTSLGPSDPGTNRYTYKSRLVPTVESLDPARGPIGGGNQVDVRGRGLSGVTSVRFGTHEAAFTIQDDYLLTATAPAVDDPYLYDVTVTTAQGVANESASSSWYLYTGTPEVWGIEARTGLVAGGETVTITGDQLLDASAVNFGWNAAVSYRVVDQHTIIAVVPPCAAGTVWVTVETPDGTSPVTFGSLYTFRTPGAPIVTTTAANRGPAGGGQTVVLTGSGFSGATGVRFEDTPATSFTVDSDTQITAVVPARGAPALINVTIDTPHGVSPNAPASWYLYE